MTNFNQAAQAQMSNIQSKLGIPLDELADIVRRTGLSEHRQIRAMIQREYSLDYGEANMLAAAILRTAVEISG